jgi:hypothetical protein
MHKFQFVKGQMKLNTLREMRERWAAIFRASFFDGSA